MKSLKLIFYFYLFCGLSFNEAKHISHDDVGIVGGHSITIDHVPYMASLRLNGTIHWCGGSIIHERFILTAAHCIVPNREYKILVGTSEMNKGGDLYDVEKIITHEKFSRKTDDYDLCLIKLAKPLVLGPKVALIKVADKSVKARKSATVYSTGWGFTEPNGPVSENLLQVKLPVVTQKACQNHYISLLRKITSRMICAGGRGKDSCQGDSGGPLTFGEFLIGVTSFGAECGVLPGVYTKVAALGPWIGETIENNLQKPL